MDRKSIIGIVVIAAILIVFSILNQPSKEDLQKQKNEQDSIVKLEKARVEKAKKEQVNSDSIKKSTINNPKADSIIAATKNIEFGYFAASSEGKRSFITLESELLKIKISNQGGRIYSVELKKYKTFEGKPLLLFDGDSTTFGLNFYSTDNLNISTNNLFFIPQLGNLKPNADSTYKVEGKDSISVAMRLYADSVGSSNKYIEYIYTLHGNDYLTGFKIKLEGMKDKIVANSSFLNFEWKIISRQQEKSLENERNTTTVYYKFPQDEVDYLSETKDEQKSIPTKLKWVSLKQQFFTSVLIADKTFANGDLKTSHDKENLSYNKRLQTVIGIPYTSAVRETTDMHIYFGPNHYNTLKQYNLDLEKQIPLGWGFFILAWINRFAVIPVFNFLLGYGFNIGIIILILTIILKIVLLPIAYKTYVSSAKMKLLKPDIEEISQKFSKKEDALKKQQATMALYKKAGANPLSGCIPMLLQMPILIAMFRFFPSSIELRQQSFLWATDLSTYDSIYNLGFNIPFYGDHVSLFTILMTISTIIYTYLNSDTMGQTNQMPGMKVMMYIMPVMFLGIFNNFSAGLSYYYFLANVLTFAQQFIIKKFVNTEKLHLKIQENKKKNITAKKSGWQQRLEDMAKQRGYKVKK